MTPGRWSTRGSGSRRSIYQRSSSCSRRFARDSRASAGAVEPRGQLVNLTIVKTLTKGEQSLVMDTRPKRLDGLSEDELLDLHARVRRGRNKYKKNQRQAGAKQVKADRSRGAA